MSPAKKKTADQSPPPAPVSAEPQKPQKPKKEKKEKGRNKKEPPITLPLLVEVGFSFSGVFLLLVDIIVAFVAYTSGATWTAIFVRVVVSTVVVGFVLWLLTMNLSNWTLAAAMKHLEEEAEENKRKAKEEKELSSVENVAIEA